MSELGVKGPGGKTATRWQAATPAHWSAGTRARPPPGLRPELLWDGAKCWWLSSTHSISPRVSELLLIILFCLYNLGDTKVLNEFPFMNIKIDISPVGAPQQYSFLPTLMEDVCSQNYPVNCFPQQTELCQKIAFNGTCQVASTKYN